MTENLTHPTDAAVGAFLDAVEHPVRRRDGWRLHDLLARLTGEEAVMWGPTIVGFGRYTYAYDSGRTGEAAAASFSPRKAATTIYLPEGTGPASRATGARPTSAPCQREPVGARSPSSSASAPVASAW